MEVTKLAILTARQIVAGIGPPSRKAGGGSLRNSRARLRFFRCPLSWPGLPTNNSPFGVRDFWTRHTLNPRRPDCLPPFARAGRLEAVGSPICGPFFGETPGLARGVSLFKFGNVWV